ncbi:MAG: hypothetical protein KDB73_08655 [Planctomycetes bacterium]|nr:hypothetical protein [Planctomycetota bacterium]
MWRQIKRSTNALYEGAHRIRCYGALSRSAKFVPISEDYLAWHGQTDAHLHANARLWQSLLQVNDPRHGPNRPATGESTGRHLDPRSGRTYGYIHRKRQARPFDARMAYWVNALWLVHVAIRPNGEHTNLVNASLKGREAVARRKPCGPSLCIQHISLEHHKDVGVRDLALRILGSEMDD